MTRRDLSHNRLRGSIPSSLALFAPELEVLRLDGNSLTGALPPQLVTLSTTLTTLSAAGNDLIGWLPAQYGVVFDLDPLVVHGAYGRVYGCIHTGEWPTLNSSAGVFMKAGEACRVHCNLEMSGIECTYTPSNLSVAQNKGLCWLCVAWEIRVPTCHAQMPLHSRHKYVCNAAIGLCWASDV